MLKPVRGSIVSLFEHLAIRRGKHVVLNGNQAWEEDSHCHN